MLRRQELLAMCVRLYLGFFLASSLVDSGRAQHCERLSPSSSKAWTACTGVLPGEAKHRLVGRGWACESSLGLGHNFADCSEFDVGDSDVSASNGTVYYHFVWPGAGNASQASSGVANNSSDAIQGGTKEDILINATRWKSFMSLNLATQFSSYIGKVKDNTLKVKKSNSDSSTKHYFGNKGHTFWVPKFSNETECEAVYQRVIAENGECAPLKNSLDAQPCCTADREVCPNHVKHTCAEVGAVTGGQDGVWLGIRCPKSMKDTYQPCMGSATVSKTEIRRGRQIGLAGEERKFTVLTIKGEYHPPPDLQQVLLEKPVLERGRPQYRSKCEMEYYVRLTTEDCCSPNGLVQYGVGARSLKESKNKGGNITEVEPTDGCKKWFTQVSTSAGAYFAYERMRRALNRTKECSAINCNPSEALAQQTRRRRRKKDAQNEPQQQVKTSANWGSGYDLLGKESKYFMVRENNPVKDVENDDVRKNLWEELMALVGLPNDCKDGSGNEASDKCRPQPPKLVMPAASRGYNEQKCWNGETFFKKSEGGACGDASQKHFASVQSTEQSSKYYPFTKFTLKSQSASPKCELAYYTRLVSCRQGNKPSCMCKDEHGNQKLTQSENHVVLTEGTQADCNEWFVRTMTGVGLFVGMDRLDMLNDMAGASRAIVNGTCTA